MIIMRFEKGKSLKSLTSLGIGGIASFFAEIKKEKELKKIFQEAGGKRYVIGAGSNLVAPDSGFSGFIIKIGIKAFEIKGNAIYSGAGDNLLDFIKKINKSGLEGMEKMAGIPGTVAGAIYGNAGAYGQEIKDSVSRVRIFDGKRFKWIKKEECKFGYRTSLFKKRKNWVIVGAEFFFKKENPAKLCKISRDIIKLREKKYRPGLLCPGSFFKNIILKNLKPSVRKKLTERIDNSKIIYGKVPSGYLLEEVGAKGMSVGGIRVAKHHGNLIYNSGGGKERDVKKLAGILKGLVSKKFGVRLEEEVQYL
ncbi:UDP-N-acetylenolpyruvoylglucosamine reductase [Candidatus Giovannonibacteria bacterium RIFCSPLOWO2_02_FULL_45_14]|uniref:UDP-N-acetylenolpyruvoylglucosamine reductase n=1 Tax=Candidatus Giovannonibacteria bacterium RIFCSPLOWO2_12_FULL_44_15 TaxID=1798364 RepID=A0A1F5Y065_9BACT|nr:MAG: UDP-N-acetylenolpyruvoylglucosamine reductase [Candidatus Giovannonibacteria bacterium RIFCSPHIGHO2_02_FULL_44_31]OGF75889.1 MAG: UDP-N-acetylenolpyruvoylglucosamine reductase [Candidatus Giovannonibacteria bacterium RIFCSPHIGHO2_12_FULL_44_29]OGF91211.1 MAG: UDP-N-acetylenolpyruvoylglucosamine reductase [Candidatus Giovannonibacteria bacterium RIFCSPLOWO2_02_FULL_45_14]OGF93503.1 MAG: UDP-N-acetylenolpyruvoylglucosamine reductase [Candidatus Giovannonibacteria bacterium RIFCSPLOWO2_12_F